MLQEPAASSCLHPCAPSLGGAQGCKVWRKMGTPRLALSKEVFKPLYQAKKARKKYPTSRHVSRPPLPPKAQPWPGLGRFVWILQKTPNLVKTEQKNT